VRATRRLCESGQDASEVGHDAARDIAGAGRSRAGTRVATRFPGPQRPLAPELLRWIVPQEIAMRFRYLFVAARRLRRAGSRGYAFAASATLALGIGAVVAIYSLLHAVLIAPLALHDEDRVVRIAERHDANGLPDFSVSTANFLSWKEDARSLQSMAAFTTTGVNVQLPGGTERVEALVASSGIWQVLGRRPLQGRELHDGADDIAAAALISERYWRQRLDADPGVLGRRLRVEGVERVIVGVAPQDVGLGTRADLWLPMDVQADAANRGDRRLTVVARLAPESTLPAARSELEGIAARLSRAHRDSNDGWSVRVDSARDWLVPIAQRDRLLLLMGAVALLLLATCANLASLQIARAAHRQRELGIRQAIGADRARLRGEMLAETVLLVSCGALAGVSMAWALLRVAHAALESALPSMATIALQPGVAMLAIVASATTALLFGLVPAALAARADPAAALAGGRSALGARRAPLRNALVGAQFAIATLLLAGAALLGHRLFELSRTELGFAPDNVLTARIALPAMRSDEELARQQRLFERLLERVGNLPGVTSVAVASDAPLGSVDTQMLVAPGPMPSDASDAAHHAQSSWRIVSPDYFATMGIVLLGGRLFDGADEPYDSVILGRSVAERVFGVGVDPVGRVVTMGNDQRKRVVGVVADTRQRSVADSMTPTVYFPTTWFLWETMTLTVRSAGDLDTLAADVRRRAAEVMPDRALYDVRPMRDVVAASIAAPRLQATVVLAFAASALLIAAVGVGSVIAYLIARRRAEFALRYALGASPSQVRREVLRSGARLALLGIAVGACAAVPLMQVAGAALHASGARIALALCASAAALMLATLAACWAPARRAASIQPASALGAE
jgi:putative ABC transport system permease protein